MNLKRILAFLLAVIMVMSFAACGESNNKEENNATTTKPQETEPQETEPQETEPQLAQVTFLTINMTDEAGNLTNSIYVMDNEDGTAHIDFVGEIVKRGEMDSSVLADITAALASSGLVDLGGRSEGDSMESMVCGSLYASFEDGSDLMADFYGQLPQEFLDGYAAMEECLNTLTAAMPEYVAVPMEMGEIADSDRAALDAILENMILEVPADSFAISGIAMDEYFAETMGLSSSEGIVSGLNFAPMMMSVAYGLNIVTLEEGADVDAVAEDFKNNIDWLKWVCVQPSNVLIATKGNQVLCLLGADSAYENSVAAIEAAEWETYSTLQNPNM